MIPVPVNFPVWVAGYVLEGAEFARFVADGFARRVGLQFLHCDERLDAASLEFGRPKPGAMVHALVAVEHGVRRIALGVDGRPVVWADCQRAVKLWNELRRQFGIKDHQIRLNEAWKP